MGKQKDLCGGGSPGHGQCCGTWRMTFYLEVCGPPCLTVTCLWEGWVAFSPVKAHLKFRVKKFVGLGLNPG
jgi:hypothetical protein